MPSTAVRKSRDALIVSLTTQTSCSRATNTVYHTSYVKLILLDCVVL